MERIYSVYTYRNHIVISSPFGLTPRGKEVAKDLTFNEAYALVLITAKNVPDFRSVYLRIRRDEVVSFAL